MTDHEINIAIHKAKGLCVHEWERDDSMTIEGDWMCEIGYTCAKCNVTTHVTVTEDGHDIPASTPAYATDPRLWTPLLEELLKAGWEAYWSVGNNQFFVISNGYEPSAKNAIRTTGKVLGSAVCEAFVKYKEGK